MDDVGDPLSFTSALTRAVSSMAPVSIARGSPGPPERSNASRAGSGIEIVNEDIQTPLEQVFDHPGSDTAIGSGDENSHEKTFLVEVRAIRSRPRQRRRIAQRPWIVVYLYLVMKIKHISTAVMESNFDWTIVKVETDEKITGYGEAFLAPG